MINFNYYANQILNKQVLMINNHPHRIIEIEFYITCQEHPDPFTHKEVDQATPDKWYFHKKGGTYKGGTFKGLDITFRPTEVKYGEENPVYGGILIRSVMGLIDGIIIEGPCRVVDRILALSSCPHILEFTKRNHNKHLDIDDETSQLYLKPKTNEYRSIPHYSNPRVGLTLKNPNDISKRMEYIMKNYRYMIYPNVLKKYRKLIAAKLYNEDVSCYDIMKCMKMTQKQVDAIINIYDSGKDSEFKNYVNKNMSADELVNLMGLCNESYSL
jgi:hypothetical protein